MSCIYCKHKKIIKILTRMLLSLFILTIAIYYGCHSSKIVVEPKYLPHAKVGEYYHQGIKFDIDSAPLASFGHMGEPVITTDFGHELNITVEYKADAYDNTVWIKGTPTRKGEYHIHIWSGGFYGGGSPEISKGFLLVVE